MQLELKHYRALLQFADDFALDMIIDNTSNVVALRGETKDLVRNGEIKGVASFDMKTELYLEDTETLEDEDYHIFLALTRDK